MTPSVHIIKAQEYEIVYHDQSEAHRLQTSISGLQQSRIDRVLDEVLNKFDSQNFVYQFNTIELNLGSVRKSNYENELAFRIEEELSKYLMSNILDQGRLRDGRSISIQNKKLDDFEFFIRNGHFKWNVAPYASTTALLDELLESQREELLVLLKQIGRQEAARKRIIFQFQDPQLEAIVRLIAKKDGDYMITYKDQVLERQKKKRVVTSSYNSVKNVLWEIILGYLLATNRSYYDKRNFLRHLIEKMASRYNLAYSSLLQILSEVATTSTHLSGNEGEFKHLIKELSKDSFTKTTMQEPLKNKGLKNQWLRQWFYYMERGTFDPAAPISSEKEFNEQLLRSLQGRDRELIQNLDVWLSDRTQRQRILAIAEERSLLEIAALSKIPSYKTAGEFLNAFRSHKLKLSTTARDFVQKIQAERGTLILSLSASKNISEKKLLHRLLRNILLLSSGNEDKTIQLLMEAKPGLTKNYQKIVAQFLMTFYQNMGKIALANIANEVLHYSRITPREFWQSWWDDKVPQWGRSTHLSQEQLLKYVGKNLQKLGASKELRSFIKQQQDIPAKRVVRQPNEENKRTLRKKQNTFLYLLEHGKLPWWIDATPFWNNFNTEFDRLWSIDTTRQKILGLIAKHSNRVSYPRMFDEDQYSKVLEELAGKSNSEKVSVLKNFRSFVNEILLPTASISAGQYHSLKEELLKLVLDSGTSKSMEALLPLLKNWEGIMVLERYSSLSNAFGRMLKKSISQTRNTQLKEELSAWLESQSSDNDQSEDRDGSPKSLRDFLSLMIPQPQRMQRDYDVLSELHKMVLARPEQFDQLLEHEGLRTSLVKELPKAKLNELIGLQLGTHQRDAFHLALFQLDRYANYVSGNEHVKIHQAFSRLVLLQLSMGGMRSWNVKDWSLLLHHSVNNVLGKSKNRTILFRIKEKVSIENGNRLNGSLRFITQLNELVDETSEKVLEETKEIFDELVEENESSASLGTPDSEVRLKLIRAQLNAYQKSHLKEAVGHIQAYKTKTSEGELKQINQLFTQLLDSHQKKGTLASWEVSDWGAVIFHSANDVLGKKKHSEVLFSITKKKAQSTPLMNTLMELATNTSSKKVTASEKQFRVSKRKIEKRNKLKQNNKIKEQEAVVLKKIGPNQLEFYRQATLHLNSYKQYISEREYRSIRLLFSKFLLSKFKNGGVNSWGMKNWGHLLYHSMNQVIGKTRNEKIRNKIKEKLNIETEIEINESQQIIDELTHLANETPQGVIQEDKPQPEDETYRKLGEEIEREYSDPVFITNSGLIILAPYLKILFERCGLMEDSAFNDEPAKYKAIQLLSYAATGKTSQEEQELVINKVLCGLDLMAPLAKAEELTELEKETVDGLLTAVTQQWTALKETSIDGLRQSFLQRDGKLVEEESFFLKVEQKSFDMLLNSIPWNISKIKLSWMQKILEVEWKT